MSDKGMVGQNGIIGYEETLGVLNINVSWLSDFGDLNWDLSYAKTCQLRRLINFLG